MNPDSNRRHELEEEKKTIIQELTRHAKHDPHIQKRFEAVLNDVGSEVDDNVHEVEEHLVDSALVETLAQRLEQIEKELAA